MSSSFFFVCGGAPVAQLAMVPFSTVTIGWYCGGMGGSGSVRKREAGHEVLAF